MTEVVIGLSRPNLTNRFRVLPAVLLARVRILSRYPGFMAMEITLPVIIALLPILMGRAAGGAQAGENFARNVGTDQYVIYLLLGANMFFITGGFLWNIAFWIRRERASGTLESVFLAPADRFTIFLGINAYIMIRSMISMVLSFSLGCLLFWVNPLQGEIFFAFLFLVIGMIPMFGLSLIFAGFLLRIREAGAVVNLSQWIISILMGVFYPITVFPWFLRWISYLLPPTWMNQGIRASMLNLEYFFGSVYADLMVMFAFALVFPALGYFFYSYHESKLRQREGVGQF